MFKDTVKKEFNLVFNIPKRNADVGIELEIEGQNLPSPAPYWQTKPEGSLQNGVEYVSKPIKHTAVKDSVNILRKYIDTSGGIIKPSYRCSTHIHMNMTGGSFADVLLTFVILTIFEPVLLRLCGDQRNGNLFCMSSFDTGDIIWSFNGLCEQIHYLERHGFGWQRGKYASFNLDRLRDLGTIEGRCFPLSVDGETVSKWSKWMLCMKDMAVAEPDKTGRTLWKNIRQNRFWYASRIFENDLTEISTDEFTDLMDTGTQIAYELTKLLKRWYNFEEKAEEKKVYRPRRKLIDDVLTQSVPQPPSASSWTIHDEAEY